MAAITGQLHAHRYIEYSVSFLSRLNQDYIVPVQSSSVEVQVQQQLLRNYHL